MKKFFLLLVLLIFMMSGTVFAEKQEWIDKEYDFKAVKNIRIEYQVATELHNGIVEKETLSIFKEKFISPLSEKCSIKNMGLFFQDNNIAQEDSTSADLIVKVYLADYHRGDSYRAGYNYTVVSPTSEMVYTTKGTVVVPGTQTQVYHQDGGNVPTAFVIVRFDVIDVETNQVVWSRIDDRAKQGDERSTPKPKKVFSRVIGDFERDLRKQLKLNSVEKDDNME